jgi:3-phenylpropionate/trans-cinnamate dioxygenase ferredoxin reductase subunit
VRLEHWSAAAATAAATAGGILGHAPRREPVPFFWSDQFGWRIQALGHVDPGLHVTAEGDADAFVARYRDARGTLRAAVVASRPGALPELRRELAEGELALAG